ncbi:DUF1707 SHOCT-like domain-containing protein [Actinomycetospora flava]|uniref:DUF1707 domain-containing protein n=1 Tax=Actinomycetospora flava TaxID=3129232 RepID=A0ABU8M7V7_9PSEU
MTSASPEPGDPAALRVSDVEREQVQQFLARAMVAGQITPGEYSDRSAAALAARVRRDLEGLLDDLPGADLHASRSVDVLDLQAGVGGAISRRGYWRVPPLVRVHSWVGGVTLDFSGAEFTTPVVAVELATGMCSPLLVLPEHATADVDDLRISAGKVRDDIHHRRERGVPHLVVRGRHSLGDVILRHPRKPRWRPGRRKTTVTREGDGAPGRGNRD